VLTAVGKPRSVRPRGRSVMSQLFYPVSVLLLFFHSIVLLFSAPLLLHFPFTPAVLLFTLLGEGTQPSCCRYGIQKIEKENERVEVRALVCSQQLLEENQTHERQPVSTNPSEALHSDQEKRCGEKDSLSFPSRPGLKLREDISATDRASPYHLSVLRADADPAHNPSGWRHDSSREAPSVLECLGSHGGLQLQQRIQNPPKRAWHQSGVSFTRCVGLGPNQRRRKSKTEQTGRRGAWSGTLRRTLWISLGLRRQDFCLRLLKPPPRVPSSDHIQRKDLAPGLLVSVSTSSWLSYHHLPFVVDRHLYIPTSLFIFHTSSCNDQNHPSASTCKSPATRLLLGLRSSEPELSCMFLVVDIFHPL
jgi:hypothetical protein